VEPHRIKTHTPYAVTRSIRHLYERKLYSIPLSDDIEQYVRSAKNPWFSYLPEVFGMAFGSSKDAWGYLVREMTPRPFKQETRCLVPLFSLYCPDKLNPDDDPMLVKMIESSGIDPKKMILNHILFPLVFCWTDLFQKRGIIDEAHGQNTLVDISDRGIPKRLVFRDFDNYVLGSMREQLGLSNTGLECGLFDNGNTDSAPKGATFSLLYDQAMRVPFDEIADLAEKYYGISRAELQSEVRNYFRSMFPTWQTYFPANGKAYNYASGVLTPGVKPKLVEGGTPEWR
jgi:siderophore synthetase component